MVRSKRRSPGLWAHIRSSAYRITFRSPSGLYLGQVLGYTGDKKRLVHVVERIMRGLYYHHFGAPLPHDVSVRVWSKPRTMLESALEHASHGWRGVDTFRYSWVSPSERPTCSIWWLLFYRAVFFACTTGLTEQERVAYEAEQRDSGLSLEGDRKPSSGG